MAETLELPVINNENYNKIFDLLTCNDEPSRQIGFSLLENVDFEKSEIYIYCLLNQMNKKVVNFSYVFEEKLPDLAIKIKNTLKNKGYLEEKETSKIDLSFRKIYEITLERKDNKEELLFLINLFSDELKSVLVSYGFSFLEYFDVIVKPKENE